MMKYTHHARTVALAGLLSAAAFALPAGPAAATTVCPPGDTNPAYCITEVTPPIRSVDAPGSVGHSTRKHKEHFTVTVKLNAKATVTISLLLRNRVVEKFSHKSTERTIDQRITAPTKTGKYEIKVVAKAGRVTQTMTQTIKVT
jgi:hypothetical protein